MMKVKWALSSLVAFVAFIPLSFSTVWTIDASHSSIDFKVKHMMVSNVKGNFGTFSGEVNLDDKNMALDTAKAEIDMASVNTNNQKRDEHLKGEDFFNVAKFPKMVFESKKFAKGKDGGFKVMGMLTLNGVTKEVVLEMTKPSSAVKDPWGNTRIGFSATGKIVRKDFGIVWNKVLDKGGLTVGEDVFVNLEMELTEKK